MAFFASVAFEGVCGVHLVVAFVGPTTVRAGGDPSHGGKPRWGPVGTGASDGDCLWNRIGEWELGCDTI